MARASTVIVCSHPSRPCSHFRGAVRLRRISARMQKGCPRQWELVGGLSRQLEMIFSRSLPKHPRRASVSTKFQYSVTSSVQSSAKIYTLFITTHHPLRVGGPWGLGWPASKTPLNLREIFVCRFSWSDPAAKNLTTNLTLLIF